MKDKILRNLVFLVIITVFTLFTLLSCAAAPAVDTQKTEVEKVEFIGNAGTGDVYKLTDGSTVCYIVTSKQPFSTSGFGYNSIVCP